VNGSSGKLAPMIRKIARIYDEATGSYLEVIGFRKSGKKYGRVVLRPSVVSDHWALARHLQDAGAILPKDATQMKNLLIMVAKTDAPKEWVYERHVGWIEGGKAYVTLRGAIGHASRKIIGINRSHTSNDPSGRLSVTGTCKGWRDSVGGSARYSSIMIFAISAGFAAPLLYVVGRRSFTINAFAPTRAGKTVATLMGATIPGIGRIEDLINWKLTDTRLEERLPEYNDALFAIDDMETMREKSKKEKYLRIRNIAYNIEQGWSTGRADSYTRARSGIHERWRCIVLTSYERSVRDLATSVNMERQAGEALRLIDVPALLDGISHIFDRVSSEITGGDFVKWRKESFKKIVKGCQANHGCVLEQYIKRLIADRVKAKAYIEARIDALVNRVVREGDGDVIRDVAEKFGLIYAGGMLAIKYDLVPWTQSELGNAIIKCYKGARDLLPDDGVLLRQGITALGSRLMGLPNVESANGQYDGLDGYRESEADGRRFIIRREVFNSIFPSEHQRQLVLGWLSQRQLIAMVVAKGAKCKGPKEQIIWPDDIRRRSYEIRLPRASKKSLINDGLSSADSPIPRF